MNPLKNLVRLGGPADVQAALTHLGAVAQRCIEWVEGNYPRNSKRVTAVNFVRSAIRYLGYINEAQGTGTALPIVALSARSIFEMDLRLRKVFESEDELNKWQAEAATDKADFFDAVVQLSPDRSMPDSALLKAEADRIRNLLTKYGLPNKAKPPQTKALADDAGLVADYPVFYRLSSKFVHPSAWIVNDEASLESEQYRCILISLLQLYSWQMLHRVRDAFGIPDSVLFPEN